MNNSPTLEKRVWVIGLAIAGRRTDGLATFFAADETLARRYAEELWPAMRGSTLLVIPADGAENGLRNQARTRFIFDCDLAAHQFAFVGECRGSSGGVCLFCGCTSDDACPGGCWWVTAQLCSACCRRAGVVPEQRAAIEQAANPGDPDCFPPELTFPPNRQVARWIRAACFALYAGHLAECHDRLLAAAAELKPHLPMEADDERPAEEPVG